MVEWEISESLHDDRWTSKPTGAAIEVLPQVRRAPPTTMLMAPHRCSLRFLIAAIKNSQRMSPSQND
jgi:hypothetical protein